MVIITEVNTPLLFMINILKRFIQNPEFKRFNSQPQKTKGLQMLQSLCLLRLHILCNGKYSISGLDNAKIWRVLIFIQKEAKGTAFNLGHAITVL